MIRRLESLALDALIVVVEGLLWAAEVVEELRNRSRS